MFGEGRSGLQDAALWARVTEEDRLFITLDLDFSDIRRFPPGTHPGILLLRPRNASREAVRTVLRRVLRTYALEELKGCLVVATDRHTRVRRPSSEDN